MGDVSPWLLEQMNQFDKVVKKYSKVNEVAPIIGLVGRAAALKAAKELDFEEAAKLRDRIKKLRLKIARSK